MATKKRSRKGMKGSKSRSGRKADRKVAKKKVPEKALKTARKKTAKVKPRRAVKKKTATKATAKKTAPRKAPVKAPAKKPPAQAVVTAPKPPAPAYVPAPNETPVGKVTHFYSHLQVAVVQLEQGSLQVGDRIHIKGHTTDFHQAVESMEIEHQRIERAQPGDVFGLKVIDHAREHDVVYKVQP